MKAYVPLTILALSGVILAGCVGNPVAYESEPVVLQTAEGPVTCQLYLDNMVVWDRATNRPDTMSVETADALCRQEGLKRLEGDTGTEAEDVAQAVI